MKLCLLVDERLGPIPANIKTVENWGHVGIITSEGRGVNGNHMLLEGEPEDFKNWLRPVDGVWVGEGNPMEQKFNAMHIKD